jgi:selenocysteine lyase/cysteine desulfurase
LAFSKQAKPNKKFPVPLSTILTPVLKNGTTDPENYFAAFSENIVGREQVFESPFGPREIVYADWTASGRAYGPIEECIQKDIMPFVGNTHTETTVTGTLMSGAYEKAKRIIKEHVGANSQDALIFCGSGTTSAVNKLQRILGLRMPERMSDYVENDNGKWLPVDELLRPVVFITEMEHHSNQISWLETIAKVEIIPCGAKGNIDLDKFAILLQRYTHSKNKIAAITACSNVTGIETPYHEIAKMIHAHRGHCFVDFAASAPYIDIQMHPGAPGADLDAIYFSPHKFLGGPGAAGVLIFSKNIYNNKIPDQPGGGTVDYTNPWGVHEYACNIEQREDGGTPPFLQGIKAAMCIRLKEAMGVENILKREEEILPLIFDRLEKIKNVEILEGRNKKRLGIISFMVIGASYNLFVKMMNDRFGIQTRGGCSCAGTYGHYLLQIDEQKSHEILHQIQSGNLLCKPGWIRLSLHPTMTNAEIDFILDAIELTACHYETWKADYVYHYSSNEYSFRGFVATEQSRIEDWFALEPGKPALRF